MTSSGTRRTRSSRSRTDLISLVSPVPSDEPNSSLLASWTYGLGKVVALTTDAGSRWASNWSSWPDYDKLFSQMVRWSMRPTGDQGKFVVASDVRGDKVRVIVNALDKDDQFLNFLSPTGNVLGPDMKSHELQLRQTAPGRRRQQPPGAGLRPGHRRVPDGEDPGHRRRVQRQGRRAARPRGRRGRHRGRGWRNR